MEQPKITLGMEDLVKLVADRYPGHHVTINVVDEAQLEFAALFGFTLGLEVAWSVADREADPEDRQQAIRMLREVADGELTFQLPSEEGEAWKGEALGGARWRDWQREAAKYAMGAVKRGEEWKREQDG